MTMFDKWFSKDGALIPEPGAAGYEGYVERREAFRGALEWIEDLYVKYDYEDWDTVAVNIRKDIEQELNDGST